MCSYTLFLNPYPHKTFFHWHLKLKMKHSCQYCLLNVEHKTNTYLDSWRSDGDVCFHIRSRDFWIGFVLVSVIEEQIWIAKTTLSKYICHISFHLTHLAHIALFPALRFLCDVWLLRLETHQLHFFYNVNLKLWMKDNHTSYRQCHLF